jgi:uncharacterized protein (DUF1501 family)
MGLAAAATPLWVGRQPVQAMHAAPVLNTLQTAETDRVLVIIQLGGGNDGLNTIVPVRNDIYYRERPRIAIPRNQTIGLDAEYSLHPELEQLRPFWGEGQMAVVHNVGYEDSSRSHFDESARWVTGSGSDDESSGWAGRYLDKAFAENRPAFPPAIRFSGAEGLFRADGGMLSMTFDPEQLSQLAESGRLYPVDGLPDHAAGEALRYAREVANAAVRFAGPVQEAAQAGTNRVAYPDYGSNRREGLGRGLATVARLVRGGLQTRMYLVSASGTFDTHANQPGTHARRMEEIADAVSTFYADLAHDGLDDRVLTMTFSEFGRTVHENGSRGTDHGAGGPMLLFGPALTGGLHGTAPDLTDTYNSGLRPTTDYHSVYRTVLEQWFGVEPEATQALLGDDYPALDDLVETASDSDATFGRVAPPVEIMGNYPNPFRSRTTVQYGVSEAAHVSLDVYNALGQHVAQPVDEPHAAGAHEVELTDVRWPSGTYLCRLQAGDTVRDHTMKLVR